MAEETVMPPAAVTWFQEIRAGPVIAFQMGQRQPYPLGLDPRVRIAGLIHHISAGIICRYL